MIRGACAAILFAGVASCLRPAPLAAEPVSPEERVEGLRRDIESLRGDLARLAVEEKGLLGELKSLEREILRRQEELAGTERALEEAAARVAGVEAAQARLEADLAVLEGAVSERIAVLYKLGKPRHLRLFLASERASDLIGAWRASVSLATRDAVLMARYREGLGSLREEARALVVTQAALRERGRECESARQSAEAARARRRAALDRVRTDREADGIALAEIEAAARELGALAAGVVPTDGARPALGLETFRGLLDWPTRGPVAGRFGPSVHPRLGTSLFRSGLDIEAPEGTPIHAVFEGVAAFSQWFRGYGLTLIIDHGGGWMSVYSHASALLVQKGAPVKRGQKIALVGDSGSLEGAGLHFELRKDGKAVDPELWLRPK